MTNNFRFLVIVGAALVGSAFILFILSNALSTWSTTSNDDAKLTVGLWRQCITPVKADATCEDLSCPSEKFKSSFCSKIIAARGFITLSCLFSGISALLSVLYCAISDNKAHRRLLLIMKGLALASLLMGIIGITLGINSTITMESDTKLSLGVAAIVGIVAVGINLVGIILMALVKPYF